ncbi:BLUF domain-containing protein [Aureisphaera galaxeae]|uniref:BLUF domain-containing protein n=1 Tax=Aureisphaera galaxeae TaxID=1538023 RepID=UPI0023501174|nr:BLUF domain-containing protein [Aureisphaera galaxeae]MDC8003234.1 BLUF domain-containing protein [Aureisphaera galaxeae]
MKEEGIGTIVYVSRAVKDISESDLNSLFESTELNNQDLEITGILLYSDKTFLQVLEGEYPIISSLYETIAEDERHYNIIKLVDTEKGNRIFEKYKTGFSIITDKDDMTNLKLLIQQALDKKEHKEVAEKLNYFIA